MREEKNRPFSPKDLGKDELSAKAVHWKEKEGFKLLQTALAKHVAHPPGKIDKSTNRFKIIPEMVPEFIVPDLTDFKLKPYISYRSESVKQDKITAKKLFHLCYADKVKEIKEQKARSQAEETQLQNEDPKVK
ncbi:hypothetical protein LOTGIDRAFT_173377 [Lottia gigantea]|uniref:39S ribosomal protein L41, mitochondrial n=1 Tax=Lottia gigantea TaxID=225164 RepID=V4B1L9_LOTGI|nr:hypothetical protein LOTGIDRAFT_173377 [Lottia gigantea]ESP00217.1 hypothetical protein LOTGIDRAFT_173377 [Lottia gigantea]